VGSSEQIHDYNPGISQTPGSIGLFWTFRIDDDHVEWEQNMRSASWRERNLLMRDFHDVGNAIFEGPSKAGRVSLDMHWSGGGEKKRIEDADNGFALDYRLTKLSTSWSGMTVGDGAFVSDPGSFTASVAILGRERNGKFFDD
jgi:hypothetical protein